MSELSRLKKDYDAIRAKHNLPDFNSLNREFEIEKLQETETDFLLRSVRRTISEKVNVIMRFVELMVMPNENSPISLFSMMKRVSPATKKEKLDLL